jgi:hypothetical protein
MMQMFEDVGFLELSWENGLMDACLMNAMGS